ncbi:hypothetical protein BY996DRAFT_6578074 [Phakopsora pachyrhizi]|uniref:Uncharacterized protein n=1 Tax=Phakopsora pachyrhizi TaxID=170000 RepID=A0AAV0B3C0_PHAPC|nr:hypothetical protein BY996DRAFT_6578074 [Phakopsora pachyrhizi]CAH7677340.1 hypothetical protein PPACK8108_LOCUS12481 [Phakopsora pachyrhizi]
MKKGKRFDLCSCLSTSDENRRSSVLNRSVNLELLKVWLELSSSLLKNQKVDSEATIFDCLSLVEVNLSIFEAKKDSYEGNDDDDDEIEGLKDEKARSIALRVGDLYLKIGTQLAEQLEKRFYCKDEKDENFEEGEEGESQTKDKDKKHKTSVRESKIGIDTGTGFPIVNNDKDTFFKPFRDNEESSSNQDKGEMSNCGNRCIIKRDRSKEMIEKRNRKNLVKLEQSMKRRD